jgi:two-component system chemotaxis sensor kinase CheA
MDLSEYLGLFLDESRESLQALNASLLDLEKDPSDPEPLTVIFRVAHSLKGMSATMGFESMATLTHRMEEVLAAMRDDGAPVTGQVVDALFACLDTLQEMVDRVAAGDGAVAAEDEAEVDAGQVLARLDAVAAAAPAERAGAEVAATIAPQAATPPATPSAAPAAGPSGDAGGLSAYDRMLVAEARERGLAVLRVGVELEPGCLLAGARAVMVARELEALGDVIASRPPAEAIERDEIDDELAYWIASASGPDEVRAAVLSVSEVVAVTVDAIGDDVAPPAGEPPHAEAAAPGTAPAAAPPAPAAEARTVRAPATVRVGTDRLDALMNLMGEMVIQRTRLAQLSNEHALGDLRGAVEEMSRVTTDLQTLIMQVRMMPVEAVFMRFPRMVRDLAQTLDKRVELVISGEETELDRAVIDGLGDPLVHMLRNAVDHGLEPPAERTAAGKAAAGTVHLSARHAGNSVIIEVRDDGRGIDPDALRASAVRKGLLEADAAAALTDAEALDLIFLPGFSTAAKTTDVSGRGVGMDAVRTTIASLNGDVSIASEVGAGSTFTIRLPLTLAIIQALLVRGADQVYALPLDTIEETVVVGPGDTWPVNGRPCMVLRDVVVPLVGLSQRLAGADDRTVSHREGARGLEVVVVRAGGSRLGVVVDGLIGQQDIVIKQLPGYLGDVVEIAGATILGDGSVALIVDVAALAAAG